MSDLRKKLHTKTLLLYNYRLYKGSKTVKLLKIIFLLNYFGLWGLPCWIVHLPDVTILKKLTLSPYVKRVMWYRYMIQGWTHWSLLFSIHWTVGSLCVNHLLLQEKAFPSKVEELSNLCVQQLSPLDAF